MEKVVKKFLWSSFAFMLISCIIVLVSLTLYMNNKTSESITEVSEIYMNEINTQLNQKFISVVGVRMAQVNAIIKRLPSESKVLDADALQTLIKNTEVRNFSCVGVYTKEGKYVSIYGKRLDFISDYKIKDFLDEKGNIIARAVDEKGERILLLGKSINYIMEDGSECTALFAGVPMTYLNSSLYLDEQNSMTYSNIIAKDGSFVIKNKENENFSNYFEFVRVQYEFNPDEVEEYISELKNSMAENQDYSTILDGENDHRYIYCSQISENSDWYFVTVMTDSDFDYEIRKVNRFNIIVMLSSILILLLIISIIFVRYFKISSKMIIDKENLRQEAIRANMAKSEFLSSMSHDIRTPMNAIVGMTEIALKNIDNSERVNDCLIKVKQSSMHLLSLINDVLDMSKIESGKMSLNVSQISLKELVENIVNIMQPQVKQKKQFFDIFIHKISNEEVCCDSVRLNQVLLNILSNAVKFTPEGGRIDVTIYQEPSVLGDNYVRTHFIVKDTGIGMSEEFQKRIFESFARENTEQVMNISGTGLGMAITKCIIDLMGGTIDIKSEQNKGTEMHVTLDFAKAAVKEAEMKLPPWNVLIVDDNEELCKSAVFNLKELGINAEWTTDGMEAVRMVQMQNNKRNDYKFVLVDWKMPNMNGIEVIKEIQKSVDKKIPIFLISAYDWSDIEDEALGVGIEGFILKPLFKSTLYYCLSKFSDENNNTGRQEENKNEEINLSGRKILLAEDIDLNFEIANEILTSVGLEVERAVNGKECLDKFLQSDLGYYDAILMDIRMPVMNGYDSAKNIRALSRADKELPIIAMTADAFSDDIQRCLECGMNAHIAKPIDVKELMNALQKYLT